MARDGRNAAEESWLAHAGTRRTRWLAEIIIEMTGSRLKIIGRLLPVDDPVQRCPDIAEAERILGWHPRTPLNEGLGRIIDYFEKVVGSNLGRGCRQTRCL